MPIDVYYEKCFGIREIKILNAQKLYANKSHTHILYIYIICPGFPASVL